MLELGRSNEVSEHAVPCGVRELFLFLSKTVTLTNYFFLQAMQYGTEDNSTVVIVPFGAWGKYKNGEINFSFSRSFASSGRWAWRPDTAIFSCNNTDTTCYKRTHPSVHRLTQCLVHLFCCQLWKMQPLLWCVIAAYSWSHFTVFIYSDQHWVSRPSSSAHHFICTDKSLGLSYDTSVSSQLLLPSTVTWQLWKSETEPCAIFFVR